ncbi:unnamed protein product [Cylindrotheca closterium]|uniref:EF-hand domain-containing protein n=1 Tax=Cylindrotheca closterium TaxID=2856 RepID=A0AAD2JNE5_9STRA|nr:unnamed protein product [Cylindrotheca closterium]
MKRLLPLCCLLWAPATLALKSSKQPPVTIPPSIPETTIQVSKSRFERYIDKVFASADSNKDGKINFTEVYELVLKIYVQLNRQAPVPPPSRETVMKVYQKSDENKDEYLTREEFEVVVKEVSERAFVRVAIMKLMKVVGAPLLAEYLIRTLAEKEWPSELVTTLVPAQYQEKVWPIISSRSFWRSVLIILGVAFLGHFVLGIVDMTISMVAGDEKRDTVVY